MFAIKSQDVSQSPTLITEDFPLKTRWQMWDNQTKMRLEL